jgi:endonuclease I
VSALVLALAAAAAQGAAPAACEPGAYYPAAALAAMQSQNGAELQATLNNVVRANTVDNGYTFAWTGLASADAWNADPSSGLVHEIYKNMAWPANDTVGNGNSGQTGWNREHVWPNSRGILDAGPDYADLHNLHVADMNINSARSNLPFDNCESANGCTVPAHVEAAPDTGKSGSVFMPPAIHRGDIARTIFYMATRYDGRDASTLKLQVTDCPNAASAGYMMGRLTTLLEWHRLDPPSARELYRNGAVCGFQGNRNPYVDFPELANKVFGPGSGYADPVSGCAAAGQITPTVTAMPTSSSTPTVPTVPTPAPTRVPSAPSAATPAPSAPPSVVAAPGELVEGDVAVVGYNSNAPKSVALVLLNDMRAGAQLLMTDNAYLGSAFKTTEGVVTFTASAALPRGTVLVWTAAATGWTNTSGSFALSTAGDNVVLLSGSLAAPSRFHYALTYNAAFDAPSSTLTSSQCALPATLAAAQTALALPRLKGGRYSGPTAGSRQELLAAISDPSLWTQSDTTVYDLASLPAFTVQVAPTPTPTTLAPTTAGPSAESPTTPQPTLEPGQPTEQPTVAPAPTSTAAPSTSDTGGTGAPTPPALSLGSPALIVVGVGAGVALLAALFVCARRVRSADEVGYDTKRGARGELATPDF